MTAASGTVVTGPIGLVDAPLIRWLNRLAVRSGPVWLAPGPALYAPELPLDDLRYMLARLRGVAGVVAVANALPPHWPRVKVPPDLSGGDSVPGFVAQKEQSDALDCWNLEQLLAQRPEPLVLATGCFDLIHSGHVAYIETAARYGAPPVVAALSSAAIRAQPKNRGSKRPLWSLRDRCTVLNALRCEPYVLIIDGPDALEMIAALRPDVWVKPTWERCRAIIRTEVRLAKSLGARIVWMEERQHACSSTAIARRLATTQADRLVSSMLKPGVHVDG